MESQRPVGETANPRAVSVIIPSYNQPEDYLRECLESVRAQTIPSWEAIVVDDGSTVGDVRKVVESLEDGRIRVITHEANRGEGAARNSGIRSAGTSLIAQLDADDRLHPRFLEATTRALEEGSADWVLVDLQLFGESADLLRWPVPLPAPCPAHFNPRSPCLFRREVWEVVGGYAEDSFLTGGVDLDFWLRAAERGVTLGHVAEPLYCYRIHPGAASAGSFPYDNHAINNALYRRHRALFDSFDGCDRCAARDRGRMYRSAGYLVASATSFERGERLRAARLAARAVSIRPLDSEVLKQFARALFPRSLFAFLHGRKRRAPGRDSIVRPSRR
jgi:glycosyltransferase involved in cell wall biosynthesis